LSFSCAPFSFGLEIVNFEWLVTLAEQFEFCLVDAFVTGKFTFPKLNESASRSYFVATITTPNPT
jgi:hypothetical protein